MKRFNRKESITLDVLAENCYFAGMPLHKSYLPPPSPSLPSLSILTCGEDILWRNLYPLALGMMALPFWCLLVAVFGFVVWIPMTKYHLLVAFALTLGTIAWGCQWDRKKSIKQGLIFTAMTLLCAGYASLFFDGGYPDSLIYHKPAVIEMKNGWNPIWEYNSERDQESHSLEAPFAFEDLFALDRYWYWSKHFPKSDWYIYSVFYAFSGNLDLGGLSRLFYIAVTFVTVFAAIMVLFHLPGYQCFFLSLVAMLNPWATGHCFQGYLDGALGTCLTILFFTFAAYLKSKDKRFLPFVVASIVIATNLKFTGVVYVAVFLVCMLIPSAANFLTAKNAEKRKGRKEFDKTLTGSLVLATVLALITGINPYLHHLYYHYTPFYPLHTVRKIDKTETMHVLQESRTCLQMWKEFNVGDANKWQQFFFEYLNTSDFHPSRPDDWIGKPLGVHTITVNKVPFGRYTDFHAYLDHDFGCLFMAAMWFSLLMMPFIRRKEHWILLLAVWATIWVQPHIWMARYIPHLWLIPVIVSCSLLSQFNEVPTYRRRFMIIVGAVLLCMLVSAKPFVEHITPRVKERAGPIAYFMQNEPEALLFDMANATPLPLLVWQYSAQTYILDLLPNTSFEQADRMDDHLADVDPAALSSHEAWISELLSQMPYSTGARQRQLVVFLGCCPVYLVANNQSEFERLSSIEEPSRTEMVQAILYLRWQQFKRTWGRE